MRSRRKAAGRRRVAIAGAALAALVALVLAAVLITGSGKAAPPPLPLPGIGQPAKRGDPFAYVPSRASAFVARAIAGSDHVLFSKSPGGALATAARVAAFRPLIDQAAAGTGIDPSILEALVFVESAGRPDVIAGLDPADASGLTQILAPTGQSLLGMHIDLARSQQLTAKIDQAAGQGRIGLVARLGRAAGPYRRPLRSPQGARLDRPLPEIASSTSGARISRSSPTTWGSETSRTCSTTTTAAEPCRTRSCTSTPRPDTTRRAYRPDPRFGDDSSLYYWRVLGAQQIMRLYRTDRAELNSLISLQTAADSQAYVLHPPPVEPTRSPPRTRSMRPTRGARSCRCLRTHPRSGSRMTRASARSRCSSRSRRRCTAACAALRWTC